MSYLDALREGLARYEQAKEGCCAVKTEMEYFLRALCGFYFEHYGQKWVYGAAKQLSENDSGPILCATAEMPASKGGDFITVIAATDGLRVERRKAGKACPACQSDSPDHLLNSAEVFQKVLAEMLSGLPLQRLLFEGMAKP